ncbi:ABC transporter substrate binding protein [Vogesella sp. DC21W]|uniref:ABC transporter substrate binding protein n=1 Tax=Vogesella aquatica TaxID=2984206 RepID=A0ABT5ISS2_9NEIS|nr:ABC transporter substrate binding protein [Vogesella aquatica]MDC7715616.1 ABC transporter substrate binding protein [Vogesella aquatica]
MTRHLAGLCLAFLFACAQAAPTVMLVDSYHAGYAWSQAWRGALVRTLGSSVQFVYAELDSKRLPRDQLEPRAAQILAQIQRQQPQLVLVADDAALRFVGTRLAGTRTPVVYLGINQNPRHYLQDHAANVTGVLERPLIRRNINLMRQLVPGMQRVLLLFDNDLTSEVIQEELFGRANTLQDGAVQIDLVRTIDYADWQRQVSQAGSRYQAIWTGLYQTLRDSNGKLVPDSEVIAWTAANSKLPLFAFWDFAIGPDKAIGGLVLSGSDQGSLAAGLVQQILFQHRQPGSLFPLNGGSGRLLFSRRALQRFGLALPPAWVGQVQLIE